MADRHIIASLVIGAILAMNSEAGWLDPPDEKKEKAIREYLQQNPQAPMDVERPLEKLIDSNAFKTNGVRYLLHRERLARFKIQLRSQSEELFGKPIPSRESNEIPPGQSITDYYYLIDANNVYIDLLIVATTNDTFKTSWQEAYSLVSYITNFISCDPHAPNITSYKYKSGWQNGTIFNQRVYVEEHSMRTVTFGECYSFTWHPRVLDYHGLPILNNIKIPDSRSYSCYLLANNHRFLVSLQFNDIPMEGLAKCQEKALEVLKGISIEE